MARLTETDPLPMHEELPDSMFWDETVNRIHTEMEIHVPYWVNRFMSSASDGSPFEASFAAYYTDLESYEDLVDPEFLEQFEDDPGGFKDYVKTQCPAIRAPLHAPSDEFDKYRAAFKRTSGETLLDSFQRMATFANEIMDAYQVSDIAKAKSIDDLEGFWDTHALGVDGVIGIATISQILHLINPAYFPLRNKAALDGLYFLTDKKYGPFLMCHRERMGQSTLPIIEPHFRYPYELFILHANAVYEDLAKRVRSDGGRMQNQKWRYRYVAAFLGFVSDETADYRKQVWHDSRFDRHSGW